VIQLDHDKDMPGRLSEQVPVDLNGVLTVSILLGQWLERPPSLAIIYNIFTLLLSLRP
jgi:hypothetical protein